MALKVRVANALCQVHDCATRRGRKEQAPAAIQTPPPVATGSRRGLRPGTDDPVGLRAAPALDRIAGPARPQCAEHLPGPGQRALLRAHRYNSVNRFVAKLKMREPERLRRPRPAPEPGDGALHSAIITKSSVHHFLDAPDVECWGTTSAMRTPACPTASSRTADLGSTGRCRSGIP